MNVPVFIEVYLAVVTVTLIFLTSVVSWSGVWAPTIKFVLLSLCITSVGVTAWGAGLVIAP